MTQIQTLKEIKILPVSQRVLFLCLGGVSVLLFSISIYYLIRLETFPRITVYDPIELDNFSMLGPLAWRFFEYSIVCAGIALFCKYAPIQKAIDKLEVLDRIDQNFRKVARSISYVFGGIFFTLFWLLVLDNWLGFSFIHFFSFLSNQVQNSSYYLGYYAMIYFGAFCISLFVANLLKGNLTRNNGLNKAIFSTIGIIAISTAIFELGTLLTQTWSCLDGSPYPQIGLNFLQWAQIGFNSPPANLQCEWTMNFAVTQYGWQSLHLGFLKNWSFGLINTGLASAYVYLKSKGAL